MDVKLLECTERPLDVVSLAAGCCYGKDNVDWKRVERCYNMGHFSVFEHASVTLRIDGISRACANQLVRHRMASFCQESMRYVKIDSKNFDWYIPCPSTYFGKTYKGGLGTDERCEELYYWIMEELSGVYNALLEAGVPAEDARMVLPLATETSVVMTMNLRELYHFFKLREDSHAQWEIRQLAELIRETIKNKGSMQWDFLMSLDKK